MKRLFILLFSATCLAFPGFADEKSKKQTLTKAEIIIISTYKRPEQEERSLMHDIEAWYDGKTETIELSMYGLGETSVYIVDSDNHEVDFCAVDGDFCQSFLIDLPPVAGHYWLVIDSELLYAEGEFTVE